MPPVVRDTRDRGLEMICTEVGAIEVGGGTPRDDVRRMLVERRRELSNEIQSRVRV
jgi:hypothetical protein